MKRLYYFFKPFVPRRMQILLRRLLVKIKLNQVRERWPINYKSAEAPTNWKGWPDNKIFGLVLTHDVDTAKGQERCLDLLDIEKKHGFISSFNFVPERYKVSKELIDKIAQEGYEIGVHGLNHDGKLFQSKEEFLLRARKINTYLQDWKSVGFRAPAMHHNLEWIHELDILYDLSTFDTDPFEPQPDGMETIFPFFVEDYEKSSRYIEMPYTLCQDFTHFILLNRKDIELWIRKADWIIKNNGMILLNSHPDYMKFNNEMPSFEEYPVQYYIEFLLYIKNRYPGQYWHGTPKELAIYLYEQNNISISVK